MSEPQEEGPTRARRSSEPPPGSPERALVLVPVRRTRGKAQPGPARDTEARVEEAVGLARAIDLDVVAAIAVPLATPTPATLFGSG